MSSYFFSGVSSCGIYGRTRVDSVHSRFVHLESLDLTFAQCMQIQSDFGRIFPGDGQKLVALGHLVSDIGFTIQSFFIEYLESKLKNQSLNEKVVPLLQCTQRRITDLENRDFFADLLAMDMAFTFPKLRPAGIANGPNYQGIYYAESGMDLAIQLPLTPQNSYINVNGEVINGALQKIQLLKRKVRGSKVCQAT